MRTMTCQELGGACDKEFTANTFQEIAEMSRKHGQEMFQTGDGAHLEAMKAMQEMMSQPGAMEKWMVDKEKEFNELAEG